MSTEPTRRGARRRAGLRRFALTLVGVLAGLVALSGAGAAVSLAQGPRVSDVQVDPSAAIEVAGARAILTVNQALADIDPDQVSLTPAAPFTVDAAGRSVGVRFTVPLDDDTEYTVRVQGAHAVGGGPEATLETTFRTPAAEVFLLQRDPKGDDTIFRSSLHGRDAVPVYSSPLIEDFRATSTRLVVATAQDGVSALHVMNRDGSGETDLTLPGKGSVQGLQVSQRGDLVGYTFSDPNGAEFASVLFTARLKEPAADPVPVEVGGEPASVDRWRFVPDSSALLLVDFDGELILTDPESAGDPTMLGGALTIDAIARGTYTAIVERVDQGIRQLDLTTGEETALVEPDRDLGVLGTVAPVPAGGEGRAGTVRQFQKMRDAWHPDGQTLAHVADDGTTRTLFETGPEDALLQSCVSPSGRYVAALVAPDIATNPYDIGGMAVPRTLETHIVDLDTGDPATVLSGFDISWCTVGPW
ncbi:hypothetical protein [Microbacterium rhizophilus]|uniref:hypothetical protein n=1 Tax=Microbacterium rhizophilus TaxID=3138934 RepID=UPI0031E815C9